jgi:hypothetical protein
MTGHFAFPATGVICGECGWIMSSDVKASFSGDDLKWERYIVFCTNPTCSHKDKRYRVPPAAAYQLEEV